MRCFSCNRHEPGAQWRGDPELLEKMLKACDG
jgi:hypothetical protein